MKSTARRHELSMCTTPNDDQISKNNSKDSISISKPPLSMKPASEYRKVPFKLSSDIRRAREQSTPCSSSSSDHSSSTKDESTAENDTAKQELGTGSAESKKNAHLKKVKQIFEASTSSETSAPSTSRIKPGKSVTIQGLQELLHKQMGSSAGKSEDYKIRKQHRSKSRTGKGLTSFASAAVRKRSRSRYSSAIKRSARMLSPSKKERPYRQWLGVSNCVTRDSKFIISSTQFRRDFTGKGNRGETSSSALSRSPAVVDPEVTSDTGRVTPNLVKAENESGASLKGKNRVGKDNIKVAADVDESMSKSIPEIADKDKVPVHALQEPAYKSLVSPSVDRSGTRLGKVRTPETAKENKHSNTIQHEYVNIVDRKIANIESSMIEGPALEEDSATISDTATVKLPSRSHHRKKDRISRVHKCHKIPTPCNLGSESDCSDRQEFIFPEKSGRVDSVLAGTQVTLACSNTLERSTPLRGLTPHKISVHESILIGGNEPPLARQISRPGSVSLRVRPETPCQTEAAALRVACTPEQTELPGEVGVPDKACLNNTFPENTGLIKHTHSPENTGITERVRLPEKSDLKKQIIFPEKADLTKQIDIANKENISCPEKARLTGVIISPENGSLNKHKSDFIEQICLPTRVDLADQINIPDKAVSPENTELTENIGTTEHINLPENAGLTEHISLPDKSDLNEQISLPEKTDIIGERGLPDKAGLSEHVSSLEIAGGNELVGLTEEISLCNQRKSNKQLPGGKTSPVLKPKSSEPAADQVDRETTDSLSWVEKWLEDGVEDMVVPESQSINDVHKVGKHSTTELSQTSTMKDNSAVEALNSSASLGLSAKLCNHAGLAEEESIAVSSPESFSIEDFSTKDETKSRGDRGCVETVQPRPGENLENSDRCLEDCRAASSNRYSSSETSHVDGFTSPEFKKMAHSVSPRVQRQPHSKGPLLRTAVRARYRSYNTLPAYRRFPSHAYTRPGKNIETVNSPGLQNFLTDKTPPSLPNKSLYMQRKSKMKNDAPSMNYLTKTTKPPHFSRCSISPTCIVQAPNTVSLLSESLQGLSESSDESPQMEVSQLSRYADVGQSSTQTETGLGRSSKLSKLLQKMNRSKKLQHSGRYKRVQAIVDFMGTLPGQLSFEKGQIIQQRLADSMSGMSYGYYRIGRLKKKRKGLFPSSCVIDCPHTSFNH
ncbi:uncharacterized protein LOC131944197 [Physella acuta]|uniref:uncharacterized protein LOC131944197 n=1 Tax=Physella acuta TaxID=109671 RepID=UPI0027DD0F2B|nr:uncharacterized protein LOC131944197 [Physella acuta]XP_059160712.1 uncharacterized protein LOC131944197 [Physella acuta]